MSVDTAQELWCRPAITRFDEANHLYYVGAALIPGVTNVLQDCGIIDYSMIPDGVRTMALERGRFVHALCQFDDEGTLDPATVDPKLEGYLAAWRRFRGEIHVTLKLAEHRGYCEKYGYAGTLDGMGSLTNAGDTIIEIKTNIAPAWAAYQTAAYANFFPSPAKYRRMAVELHKDGTFGIHEYRCTDFSRDLGVFLSALTVYNAKRIK